MSKTYTSGLRRGARIGSVAAAAAVALGFLSAGAANADSFVPLPDGQIVAPGDKATVTRTEESALISPSMAANPTNRVAWVSGKVTAQVNVDVPSEPGKSDGSTSPLNGTNNSSTHRRGPRGYCHRHGNVLRRGQPVGFLRRPTAARTGGLRAPRR